MQSVRPLLLSILVILSGVSVVSSQTDEDTCPALALAALETAREVCSGTERNQICYGNLTLEADPQPDVAQIKFDDIGDVVNVATIRNLRLSAMNTAVSQWGVALIEIQANIPASSPENVTLVLFGDVELQPEVPPPTTAFMVNTAANIRRGPTTNAPVVGWLAPGTTIHANGRLPDDSWIRVDLPEDAIGTGWIFHDLVDGELDLLSAVDNPTETAFRPLQAFTFATGSNESLCNSAPTNGLMIQTPEGVGEVRLVLNQVAIVLGSTVFFTADRGDDMTIQVLEGRAKIEIDGEVIVIPAGAMVRIPMDENLRPAGAPTTPEPRALDYADPTVAALVDVLPDTRSIIEPLTQLEVESFYAFGYDLFDTDVFFDDLGDAYIINTIGNVVYLANLDETLTNVTGVVGEVLTGENGVTYIVDDAGNAVDAVTGEVLGTVDGVTGAVTGAVDGVTGGAVGGVTDTVNDTVNGVTDTVNDTVNGVTDTVSDTVDDVADTVDDVVGGVGGLLGGDNDNDNGGGSGGGGGGDGGDGGGGDGGGGGGSDDDDDGGGLLGGLFD